MYACVCACVHVCLYVCAGRDIISDKTKYMHSEDSDKLVYLSSLICLHLRYMGNEHKTSLLLVSSHQNGQTDPSNCYAYIFFIIVIFYLFIYLFFFLEMICPDSS